MNNKQKKLFIKQKNIELVLLYFRYRNVFNYGFQSYRIFKNMIIYITGIHKTSYIRNIFEILLSRGIFKLKYIYKSRFYIFNPYNLRIDTTNKQYIIDFN